MLKGGHCGKCGSNATSLAVPVACLATQNAEHEITSDVMVLCHTKPQAIKDATTVDGDSDRQPDNQTTRRLGNISRTGSWIEPRSTAYTNTDPYADAGTNSGSAGDSR